MQLSRCGTEELSIVELIIGEADQPQCIDRSRVSYSILARLLSSQNYPQSRSGLNLAIDASSTFSYPFASMLAEDRCHVIQFS